MTEQEHIQKYLHLFGGIMLDWLRVCRTTQGAETSLRYDQLTTKIERLVKEAYLEARAELKLPLNKPNGNTPISAPKTLKKE